MIFCSLSTRVRIFLKGVTAVSGEVTSHQHAHQRRGHSCTLRSVLKTGPLVRPLVAGQGPSCPPPRSQRPPGVASLFTFWPVTAWLASETVHSHLRDVTETAV